MEPRSDPQCSPASSHLPLGHVWAWEQGGAGAHSLPARHLLPHWLQPSQPSTHHLSRSCLPTTAVPSTARNQKKAQTAGKGELCQQLTFSQLSRPADHFAFFHFLLCNIHLLNRWPSICKPQTLRSFKLIVPMRRLHITQLPSQEIVFLYPIYGIKFLPEPSYSKIHFRQHSQELTPAQHLLHPVTSSSRVGKTALSISSTGKHMLAEVEQFTQKHNL